MSLPDGSAWMLDPDVAYLNHGSFGATPTCVLAEQQALRTAMERNPVDFLVRRLPELLESVRAEVAAFLGADADGLVFTDNATTGTQTVIAQARLQPGDEVLTTDHCYPAALAQLRRAAEASGALVRIAPVPLTVDGRAAVAGAVLSGLTHRTKLVVVDHIASCSGLVFPVEDIAAECRRQGVPVLIDGAHAAGQLPVDLGRIGADFWVGNLHKWVSAPKAAAALHVAPQWRDTVRPLVTSHGLCDGYRPSFDWTGTRDPSALLAVPAALAFFGEVGWQDVHHHNNALAARGAELAAKCLGTTVPLGGELSAAMRLVPLTESVTETGARDLERRLADEHRVVVPVTYYGGWRWLRVSAQLYNAVSDYERLADALAAVVGIDRT
jgi:isopenicillin-N epimerase